MKRTFTLLTLCAIATAAHAQQSTDPKPAEPTRIRGTFRAQEPAQGRTFRSFAPAQARTIYGQGGAATALAAAPRPAWLDKTITLDFKSEKPADAAKIILKAAGRNVETVETDKDLPAPSISLSVKNVQVGDALAAVGRLANAIAYVSEKDDKVTITFRKRTTVQTAQVITTINERIPVDMQAQIKRAMETANSRVNKAQPMISAYTFGSRLPDKKVSLDVRNTDAREILKRLLKQADVDFILEEDVPEKKFSFTFENISLRYALDAVCSSMEVGWGVQQAGTEKGAKVTVRIGKKWLKHSTIGSFNFFDGDKFNTHFAFPSFPDANTNLVDVTVPVPPSAPSTVNGLVREIEVLEIER